MPLPFNKTLDLKLLRLVKENQILYNTKHDKYLDFDSREVVWHKIGDTLNRPATVCKSRWVNIRDMMRRKIRDRIRNPTQRSYNYKYEEELSFIVPFFKESNTGASEDYTDFLDETETEIPTIEYVDQSFEREREVKPVVNTLRNVKRIEEYEGFQDLNPTDPLDVFLITIGSTLRKFSPYYLNQAKSKIFQLVQDYELQQIVDKDGQVSGSGENSANR